MPDIWRLARIGDRKQSVSKQALLLDLRRLPIVIGPLPTGSFLMQNGVCVRNRPRLIASGVGA
jgi:hypothetical protein